MLGRFSRHNLLCRHRTGGMMVTIMKNPFINTGGVTVKELKEILSRLPDTDENGELYEVWVGNTDVTNSPVTSVWSLNKKQNGCDVLLEYT